MGDFADDAIGQSLEDYWEGRDEFDEHDDDGFAPYGATYRRRRKRPSNQEIFSRFKTSAAMEDF